MEESLIWAIKDPHFGDPLQSQMIHFCSEHCRTSIVIEITDEGQMMFLSTDTALSILPRWLWVVTRY